MALGTPTTLGATGSGSLLAAYGHLMSGAAPSGSRIFIYAAWWASSAQTLTSITGTTGLTWTRVGTGSTGGSFHGLDVYYADAPSGHSAVTVTANFSGTLGGCNLHMWYQTGVVTGTTGILDGTPATAYRGTPASANWTVGPVTTTNANDTVYACAFADGPTAPSGGLSSTQTAPWAEVTPDLLLAANDWGSTVIYRTVAATGSYSASENWQSSGTPTTPTFGDNAFLFAVQEAGGGGGGTPFPAVQIVRSNIRIGP